jgi:hypothetical protein
MGRHLTTVGQPLPGVSDARGHIQAPMFLRRARRDLALVQRNLERTKAGSRRHAKALVRRRHGRVGARRATWQQRLAVALTDKPACVGWRP